MRSVVVHCLGPFLATVLVLCHSVICIQDQQHFVAEHNVTLTKVKKIMQKTLTFYNDSSEPVPSTSSELVDNRLPAQEGKQTSQESASASKKPRSRF